MNLLLIFSFCVLYLHVDATIDVVSQAAVIKEVEKLNVDTILNNEYEQSLLGLTTVQINLIAEISNAEAQLNNYRTQLDLILGVVKSNDKEKFENIITEAKSKLIEWSLKGKQSAVDVSKCLSEGESSLSVIFDKFVKDDSDCFDEEYRFELSKIDETQNGINTIVNTFKAFDVERLLKGCQASKSLSCINDLNREVTKLAATLPVEISKKLHDIMPLMNATPDRLQVCSTKYLVAMPIETQKVTDGVANCAQPLFATQ